MDMTAPKVSLLRLILFAIELSDIHSMRNSIVHPLLNAGVRNFSHCSSIFLYSSGNDFPNVMASRNLSLWSRLDISVQKHLRLLILN